MANELLSPPVAGMTIAVAGAGVAMVARRVGACLTPAKTSLMGILGAFIFAAQMVNFPLPFLPGTSGHLVGSVLLAAILGPWCASLVMTSVVVLQCLIFQDGGLLALGCNIINMALAPSFVGWSIYRLAAPTGVQGTRRWAATMAACMAAVLLGALLVCVEVAASGVLLVPAGTFLTTMLGVHAIIGVMEGLITCAVLGYLYRVRPDVLGIEGTARLSMRAVYATLIVATVAAGAGLALAASEKPDGLEWSYLERPDQPDFTPVVSNPSETAARADELQSRYTPLPDYTIAAQDAARGWTSFAAVVGSVLTMAIVWAIAYGLRAAKGASRAPCTD